MTVFVQLRCDMAQVGCQRTGPSALAYGPATVGVVMPKLLQKALDLEWIRVRGKGWVCPACSLGRAAQSPGAKVVNLVRSK